MKNIPLALQAYSLRQTFPTQPLATLRTIRETGFTGVEFYGSFFKPAFYRALLEETGLVCCGWHTPVDNLEGEKFGPAVELNLAVGSKFLCVPWFQADTADGWKRFADRLNAAAEKLRPFGLRTGYHCHAHDFKPVEGAIPWEIVAENTGKDVVLQLDTGNAMSGGADVMATLKKFPGRNQTIHWKPWSAKDRFHTPAGSDGHDWSALLDWCETEGRTEWAVLEYEEPDDPIVNIRRSAEFFAALG